MKNKYCALATVLLLLIAWSGCVKEELDISKVSKSVDVNAEVAAPIGYTTLSMDKILAQNGTPKELIIDADGFMTLRFTQQIFSLSAEELIRFDAMNQRIKIANDSGVELDLLAVPMPMQIQVGSYLTSTLAGSESARLDSAWINSLLFTFDTKNNLSVEGTVTLTFPTLKRKGLAVQKTLTINDNDQTLEVKDCVLYFENTADLSNAIPVEVQMNITSGYAIVPDGGTIANFGVTLDNVNYEAIFGDVGNQYIDVDMGVVQLDMYETILQGVFHFDKPELKLRFNNSFGVPMSVIMSGFYVEGRDGATTDITGNGVPTIRNPKNLAYPSLAQMGTAVSDSIMLTPENTNLFDVLAQAPVELGYSVEGETGYESSAINFVHRTSVYDVQAELTLPLSGYADLLVMQDTMALNINDFYKDIEEVQQLTFQLSTTNSYPIEVGAQVFFADANMNIIDSLFATRAVIGGGVDSNNDGISEPHKNEVITASLSRARVEQIQNTAYVILQGRLNTTGHEQKSIIKLYSFYELYAHLGVVVSIVTNTTN